MNKSKGKEVFIVVDGIERGRIDLDITNSTRFSLDKDSREIEIFKSVENKREFLEVFPVNFEILQKEPYKQKFQLENGDSIIFDFVPVAQATGDVSRINCGITFDSEDSSVVPATTTNTAMAATAGVANTGQTTSEARKVEKTTAFETSSEKRGSNKGIMIPAVILLMLLLTVGIGWLRYSGWNSGQQIAKNTGPDKEKKQSEVSPKVFSKKEDTSAKAEVAKPDDISGGGDGDGDDGEKVLDAGKADASGDNNLSNSNDYSASNNSFGTSNGNGSVSGLTKSEVSPNRKKIRFVKRTNDGKSFASTSSRSASKGEYPKGNRVSADRLRINAENSTIEIIREPAVKQNYSAKNQTRANSFEKTSPNSDETRIIFEQNVSPVIEDQNTKTVYESETAAAVRENADLSESEAVALTAENVIPNDQVAQNGKISDVRNVIEGERAGGKSLLEIEKVFLEWDGDIDTGVKINQKVIETIQKAGFAIMNDRDNADASLKIRIRQEEPGSSPKNPRVSADMWLTNSFGTVLTPTDNNKTLWKYDGKLQKMPKKIVADINGLATAALKEKQEKESNLAQVNTNKTQKNRVFQNRNHIAEVTETDNSAKQIKPSDNKIDSKNVAGKSLLEVEKINLEWQGDIDTGVKINQEVIEKVQYDGGLDVMRDKKDADATLKIKIKKESEGATADNPNVTADMWLINSRGKTLTPTNNGKTAWKYRGELKKMPTKIVEDIGGLKKAEQEKKQQTQENQDID